MRSAAGAIAAMALSMTLCGCDDFTQPYGMDKYGIAHAVDVREESCRSYFHVISVEANGETHEYLMFSTAHRGGLTHLPNCRYCGMGGCAK